jgi:hypothetical protein
MRIVIIILGRIAPFFSIITVKAILNSLGG